VYRPGLAVGRSEKAVFAALWKSTPDISTYTDFQIGRLINHLKENNLLENTLVFVIIGDNGASKEGI